MNCFFTHFAAKPTLCVCAAGIGNKRQTIKASPPRECIYPRGEIIITRGRTLLSGAPPLCRGRKARRRGCKGDAGGTTSKRERRGREPSSSSTSSLASPRMFKRVLTAYVYAPTHMFTRGAVSSFHRRARTYTVRFIDEHWESIRRFGGEGGDDARRKGRLVMTAIKSVRARA